VRTIPKGTEITCPNGHEICVAKHDIQSGDLLDRASFEWIVDMPEHGALADCPICGARYGTNTFHTKNGWLIPA
jgi:hypothetical protein